MTEYKKVSIIVLVKRAGIDDRQMLGRIFPELLEKTTKSSTEWIRGPSEVCPEKMIRQFKLTPAWRAYFNNRNIDINLLDVEVVPEKIDYLIKNIAVYYFEESPVLTELRTKGAKYNIWFMQNTTTVEIGSDKITGQYFSVETKATTEIALKSAHRKMVGGILNLLDSLPDEEVSRVVAQCGEIMKTETTKTSCTFEEIQIHDRR